MHLLEILWMPLEAVHFETHSKWAIGNIERISLAFWYVVTLPIGKILSKYPLFTKGS